MAVKHALRMERWGSLQHGLDWLLKGFNCNICQSKPMQSMITITITMHSGWRGGAYCRTDWLLPDFTPEPSVDQRRPETLLPLIVLQTDTYKKYVCKFICKYIYKYRFHCKYKHWHHTGAIGRRTSAAQRQCLLWLYLVFTNTHTNTCTNTNTEQMLTSRQSYRKTSAAQRQRLL